MGVGAAGVVLAGGRSRRMGTPKAALDWHGRPLLAHVLAALAPSCAPLLVVGAVGQELPRVDAQVVRDAVPDGGPVAGVAAGLAAAARAGAGAAVVCSTDLPLLHPAFVARLQALLRPGDEAVVPVLEGRVQPLVAVYRTGLAARAAELAESAAPVRALLTGARQVGAELLLADEALRAADPGLASVRGVNTPAELAAVRARSGPGGGH